MVRDRAKRLRRVTGALDSIVRRALDFEETYARQLEQLHPRQVEGGATSCTTCTPPRRHS